MLINYDVMYSYWISVKEHLPKEDNRILIWCGRVELAVLMGDKFFIPELGYKQVVATHWMSLPEAPGQFKI